MESYLHLICITRESNLKAICGSYMKLVKFCVLDGQVETIIGA